MLKHLCESPVRENRTLGLSGGRRLAFEIGASSDPTLMMSMQQNILGWKGLC